MYLKCQRCDTRKDERLMRKFNDQILCPFCRMELLHEQETKEYSQKDTAVILLIITVIIVSLSIVGGFYWGFNRA